MYKSKSRLLNICWEANSYLFFVGVYLFFVKKNNKKCYIFEFHVNKPINMKKIIIFLFFVQLVNSQSKKELDSLFTIIKKDTKKDTSYVLTLVRYNKTKLYIEPDAASQLKGLNEAATLSNKLNYTKGKLLSNEMLGVVYQYLLLDYDKALVHYKIVLSNVGKSEDIKTAKLMEQNIPGNIGAIYFVKEDYDEAERFTMKSLKAYVKSNSPVNPALYLSLGNIEAKRENFLKAISYFDKVIEISRGKSQMIVMLINTLSAKSSMLLDLDRKEESYKVSSEALKLLNENKIDLVAGIVYMNHGRVAAAKKLFDEAEIYAHKGLEASKSTGNQQIVSDSYSILYQVYKEKKDFEKSLKYYEEYVHLRDTLVNQESNLKLSRAIIENESEQKQAIANAEIQKQKVIKNTTMITSSVVLLSGIFLFVGFRKRQRIKQNQKELLLKTKISDTELKALRLQMNPHFIFNSLNSISDYIQKNDLQSADYFLSKFAKLMRGILENSEEKEIPIADELKMLELYMTLEASRLNDKFSFEINVDQDIDTENTFIPPLILQPFVENSIWHGLSKKEGKGKIIIHITKDNSMLNCIVEDNGLGRNNNEGTSRKSYGMKITKDRLDVLNKLKNTNASVNLIDLEKGTRVEVKLPLETDNL